MNLGSGSCWCKYKRSENEEIGSGYDHYMYRIIKYKEKRSQPKLIKIKTASN